MAAAAVAAAVVVVVVWGSDLLRCGSDAAEEVVFALTAG